MCKLSYFPYKYTTNKTPAFDPVVWSLWADQPSLSIIGLVQPQPLFVFCNAPFHVDLHFRHIFNPCEVPHPGLGPTWGQHAFLVRLFLSAEAVTLSYNRSPALISLISAHFYIIQQRWTSFDLPETFLIWQLSSSCCWKYGKAGPAQVSHKAAAADASELFFQL